MNNFSKDPNPLETGHDECSIHGICSISPTLAALKGAIFAYLQELAFYIARVHELGAHNNKIKNDFIDYFSVLIINSEYSEEVLHKVVVNIHNNLHEVKTLYKSLCVQNDVPIRFFKSQIKLGTDFKICDLIKQGQKYNENFRKNLSEEQKKCFEIILIILKSICLYIIELQSLNADFDKYYEELLGAISTKEFSENTVEQLKEHMYKYSKIDYELLNVVYETRKKIFGDFIESDLSLAPKEGKAILVAGANMRELEFLLEATKDRSVDVYTHGQMIAAHTFPKLKAYPNLIGHYGKGYEHYISDFTSFPGPIFLTKSFWFKVENLYSSRLFTSNKITPKNTTTITDNDFEPIIRSAHFMEGFTETHPEQIVKTGFTEQNYSEEINNVIERIKSGEIKNIFTIGVSNKMDSQAEYFKKFLDLLQDDCFAFSASYQSNFKNILCKNLDYTFPLLYKLLEAFTPLRKDYGFKLNVLATRCEPHSIPNIVNLKQFDIDNFYFDQCSPNLINPALLDSLLEWFGVKRFTNPENDFREMIR